MSLGTFYSGRALRLGSTRRTRKRKAIAAANATSGVQGIGTRKPTMIDTRTARTSRTLILPITLSR